VGICNHHICDYMRLRVITATFATTYQLHQIWGGFMTILRLMCNYYLFNPLMWKLLGLYSFMNKLRWPISCMCNQILLTNQFIMYSMGMISIHIWGYIIKKSNYTKINFYYKWLQRFNVQFLRKVNQGYIKGVKKNQFCIFSYQ